MKREGIAALLLAALFAASLINVACLDRLVGGIAGELVLAEERAVSGDFRGAEAAFSRAQSRWSGAKDYLEIMIRHPEIDAISDAFCECRELLAEENAEGLPSAFEILRYHLRCIDEMEHIRPGSVL